MQIVQGSDAASGEAPRPPVICRNCGSENHPDARFCESCGNRLGGPSRNEHEVPVRRASQPPPRKRAAGSGRHRKIEAWHIAVVLSLITVVLIVLYVQERSSHPAVTVTGQNPADVEAVLTELQDAVRINPGDPAARLRLANALHDAKRYAQAITEYKKYLEMQPRDVDARIDMGICYFQTGDSKAAIDAMMEGLRINPKHQLAMFNLGVVNLQARNMDEARSWFERAVAVDSTSDVGKRAKMMIQQHSF